MQLRPSINYVTSVIAIAVCKIIQKLITKMDLLWQKDLFCFIYRVCWMHGEKYLSRVTKLFRNVWWILKLGTFFLIIQFILPFRSEFLRITWENNFFYWFQVSVCLYPKCINKFFLVWEIIEKIKTDVDR